MVGLSVAACPPLIASPRETPQPATVGQSSRFHKPQQSRLGRRRGLGAVTLWHFLAPHGTTGPNQVFPIAKQHR